VLGKLLLFFLKKMHFFVRFQMGSASNVKSFFFFLERAFGVDVYVSGCVHGRERKCKTFMKGGEEDDVARTLFETSAFGLVLILLMLSMPGS